MPARREIRPSHLTEINQRPPTDSGGQLSLQTFLLELASLLLSRGMTPARFNQMAKLAFVQAAGEISRLRNGRVNQSRVAALTGMRRGEVRKLLSFSGDTPPLRSRSADDRQRGVG